ncbi:MAG: protein adenylyltransferase SelO family protein, partial [Oscillatoria sp. PMC 1076.18]|nr:protein adenylyltransferase SelO family protein [Oscillatoria sp. PMC 1076.18]
PSYNPQFTAAYFDYSGLYCYENQPLICKVNLEKLQKPLALVMADRELEAGLAQFDDFYQSSYYQLMLRKLGLQDLSVSQGEELVKQTVQALKDSQVGYHLFFAELAEWFSPNWRNDSSIILENASFSLSGWQDWLELYHNSLNILPAEKMAQVADNLQFANPKTALLRPIIESIWEPITLEDNWEPFYDLIEKLQRNW